MKMIKTMITTTSVTIMTAMTMTDENKEKKKPRGVGEGGGGGGGGGGGRKLRSHGKRCKKQSVAVCLLVACWLLNVPATC